MTNRSNAPLIHRPGPLGPLLSDPFGHCRRRRSARGALVASTILLTAFITVSAAEGAETSATCGDTISGTAVLSGDCTGSITITKGKLHLNGHTLTSTGLAGVECELSCAIIGPGRIISGGASFGVLADGRVKIDEVEEISGHSGTGVRSNSPKGGVRVDGSAIIQNGTGVSGSRVVVNTSSISSNTGNGIEATNRGVKTKLSMITENGRDGISAPLGSQETRRIFASNTEISGNAEFGMVARKAKLSLSFMFDNALDPDCQVTKPCADIGAVELPKIVRFSTCESSMQVPDEFSGSIPIGPPWGVCTND